MNVIKVEKINEVHLRVFSEDGIEAELGSYFTFEVPGAKFTPMFRSRLWDGKIRLYDQVRKTLYAGLYSYLVWFAEQNGYQIETSGIEAPDSIAIDQMEEYIEQLDLHSRDQQIEVRDYQLDAVLTGLCNRRGVLLSPTGSGKSLIIYIICRWLLDQGKKVVVIVPTTSLVEQMYSDFADYSSHNGWGVSDHCQKLYSGFSKHFESNILFTTWQSIYEQPKSWFGQFDVVIGDEAHQFKAKSLTSVMEKMTDVKYRIGTTGSLDDKKINKLVLEGIFGPVVRVTSTKKLQDEGKLAKLKITALLLKYPEDVRKQCAKMEYHDEVDFLVTNDKRNKFIRNLALKCTGNTLLLFQFVEKHGTVLEQLIRDKIDPNRKLFFVHGGTDVEDREAIRHILAHENDAIVVASFGVFSTGINIPSISNVIFASPSKSKIRNLQSIGRGLRLSEGKTHCNLFDITDDLHWKAWKNHTLKHGAERYKLYNEEQFEIQLVEVNV